MEGTSQKIHSVNANSQTETPVILTVSSIPGQDYFLVRRVSLGDKKYHEKEQKFDNNSNLESIGSQVGSEGRNQEHQTNQAHLW